jgi:hypothetical protein
MQKFFLFSFVLLVSSFAAEAQVEFIATAGLNNTQLFVKEGIFSKNSPTCNWKWQAGVSVILPLEKGFYGQTGVQYENKLFHQEYIVCCTIGRDIDYHANYLTLPFGLGYEFKLRGKKQLRVGGGGFVSMATGGRREENTFSGDIVGPGPSGYGITHESTKLVIGDGPNDDLKRFYYGAQANIAAVSKRFMVQLQDQLGLTTANPNRYSNFKQGTAAVNIGYRINH